MAEHMTDLPEQATDRALTMMTDSEYEKTCASRVITNAPGQVFDAIKKAYLRMQSGFFSSFTN